MFYRKLIFLSHRTQCNSSSFWKIMTQTFWCSLELIRDFLLPGPVDKPYWSLVWLYRLGFSREIEPLGYLLTLYVFIYFKGLAYIIVGVFKSKICRADGQAVNSLARAHALILRQNSFFLRETPVWLLRLVTDYTEPTHPDDQA